eukprot:scaffold1025_cov381-Prasinococcus_capsulatus_cf.AAC.4
MTDQPAAAIAYENVGHTTCLVQLGCTVRNEKKWNSMLPYELFPAANHVQLEHARSASPAASTRPTMQVR